MILELRHNRSITISRPYKVIVKDIDDAVRILKILRGYDKYSGWGSNDFDQLYVFDDITPPNDLFSKRVKWIDENGNDLDFYMRGEVSQ
jgi:hypothetical protein